MSSTVPEDSDRSGPVPDPPTRSRRARRGLGAARHRVRLAAGPPRRARLLVLALLAVASLAYGLAIASLVSPPAVADEQTETYTVQVPYTETYTVRVPYTQTYTVDVPYTETYTVRVPYTETYTVQVPYQQTYTVRVPYTEKYTVRVPYERSYTVRVPYQQTYTVRVPYTEKYTVRVPSTETYRARVAPFTRRVAAYNYKKVCYYLCRRVRVAPYTRSVAVYNYETRTRTVYRNESRTRTAYRNESRTRTAYRNESRTRTAYRNESRTRTAYRNETRTRTAYRPEVTTRTLHRDEQRTRTAYRLQERTRTAYRNVQRTRTVLRPAQRTRPKTHTHTCPQGQELQGHDQCTPTTTTTTTTTTAPPTTTTAPPTTATQTEQTGGATPSRQPTPVERVKVITPLAAPLEITGLKCSAASSDTLTATWKPASGAARYEGQSSVLPSAPHLVPWDTVGTPTGGVFAHTFKSLGTGQVFTLAVRAVGSGGGVGPVATVKCSTTPRNLLTLECTTNALLVAKYSDPYADTGLAPTSYKLQMGQVGETQTNVRHTKSNVEVWPAEYEAEYSVTVTASHETGWATYTETDAVTCPAHTHNWNSPNFVSQRCTPNLLITVCVSSASEKAQAAPWKLLTNPRLEPDSSELVLVSRRCTARTTSGRTCQETWAENITLVKDPDSLWEALGFTEWNGPADILRNLGTGLAFAGLVAAATAGQGYLIAVSSAGVAGGNHVLYYFRKADDTETIKLFPLVEAVPAIGDLTVTNFQGCLKSHYGIKQKSDTVKSVETFGTFSDVRISKYYYCQP